MPDFTGVDHASLSVTDLDRSERFYTDVLGLIRLEALGIEYTPIRDMEFGAHLNFRDPDRIALELSSSNETLTGWFDELRERELARDEIDARLAEHLATSMTPVSP